MGLFVDRSAEQGEDRFTKNQIDSSQYETEHNAENNSIANRLMCILAGIAPQCNAHKGTAAIANKYGDSKRHHRKREHDRVGGVAVGAQIAGVCNKDLVHDVIQRAHQQRNNARDRVFLHQLADALRAEELIGTFHGIHLYLSILGQTKTTSSTHATGFTHECYSLYEIIIACPPGICKGSFAQDLYWAFCADCTRQTLWKMPFEARRPTVVQ